VLLVVDAGNTQTVIGLYDDVAANPDRVAEDGLVDHWRLATAAPRTSDETAVLLQGLLGFRGFGLDDVDGMAVS
jgi:type III pantothenate kinase